MTFEIWHHFFGRTFGYEMGGRTHRILGIGTVYIYISILHEWVILMFFMYPRHPGTPVAGSPVQVISNLFFTAPFGISLEN